jgi:hypothetical protein
MPLSWRSSAKRTTAHALGALLGAGFGRVVAGSIGAVVLLLAIIVAWRTDAAVALLVVAAVLLVLGLFDWTELRASHGETSLVAGRHLDRAKEGVQALSDHAAEQGWSAEDRTVLRDALDAVAAASAVTAAGGPSPSGGAASHEFLDDGSVRLRLHSGYAHMISFLCIVEDPSVRRRSIVGRLDMSRLPNVWLVEATFPDDFETDYDTIQWTEPAPDPVPKLPPGKYRVWWQQQHLQSGTFIATPIEAEDSFEIPDPRVGPSAGSLA